MTRNKIGSLAVLSLILAFAACGDDSSSGPSDESTQSELSSSSSNSKSSSSSKTKDSSSSKKTDSTMVIKNKTISGYAQSPFLTGSKVVLYELDSTSLMQTGRKFAGEVSSDDGHFSLEGVTLASPYVLLKVSGDYQYVTDGSFSTIGTLSTTLNVLTNLKDRKQVNINLLTHLEYGRALYLVTQGLGVSEAKKQAETEIFKAFGIQGDFAKSEDLDIFGSNDGDAALLAVSLLMRHEIWWSDDFNELLSDFADDIKKDGKWDSKDAEAVKAEIADWARNVDLATIRSNIKEWDFATDVPNFEKYVTQYWLNSYGLSLCETAIHGVVKENKNPLSSTYKVNFFCDDDNWRVAKFYELKELGKKYFLNPDIDYGTMTDSRDGQTYKTVTIGKQTWMAENLNYADSVNSWCFDNKIANCDFAGRLYTWAAAIDSAALANDEINPLDCGDGKTCTMPEKVQGICPKGWHLPTNEEWETLFTTVGPSNAGKHLKSQSGWPQSGWASVDDYGTDKYGFSAIPTGDGDELWQGDHTSFWSATEYDDGSAYRVELRSNSNDAELEMGYKGGTWWGVAYSVRCVKDSE